MLADPEYRWTQAQRIGGYRTLLGVPIVRDDVVIGVIAMWKERVEPFTPAQIQLVNTFSSQASIAIENARLFNETKEALERQTATADILRVISSSPTDIQPVLDAVASTAARLCGASEAVILRIDGDVLRFVAHYGSIPAPAIAEDLPLDRGLVSGRAVIDRRTIHAHDLAAADEAEFPLGGAFARRFGQRTVLSTPLLREGQPIGAITIRRMEVRPFSDQQIKLLEIFAAVMHYPDSQAPDVPEYARRGTRIRGDRALLIAPMLWEGRGIGSIFVGRATIGEFSEKEIGLLKTFADQAVIAIENVRLFQELQARTRELARSVEELRALGDVGQAVSSTLDLETVLTTIVSRADELSGTDGGAIYEYDEASEELYLRATRGFDEALTRLRLGEGATGRAVASREPVQIPDVLQDEAYRGRLREFSMRSGFRAALAVPLLREDRILGALTVVRKSPGAFPPAAIELLKTFASQSALAIQNARLFRELEDKRRELEVANRHKSEFLANMSHELRTPLNSVIGFSDVLLERMFGEVNEKQADYLEDIRSSGEHLLSLINDILDLSKIEAGRMELALSTFDPGVTLENTVTLVRERAARNGVELDLEVDDRLTAWTADERKFKQIVLNLVSNAVKFTPQGGKVTVRASCNDGGMEVAVTDTGIGIAPEDQALVFEEFRQVGADYTTKVEGTGLGLALTRKLVELHGGRIWLESEMGKGSTFTFTLPLQYEEAV